MDPEGEHCCKTAVDLEQSESEVAQSCPTLRDPMDCSIPGSFIHGSFQARVLEWGAIAFSGGCVLLISIFIALFIPKGLNVRIAVSTSMYGPSHVA